MINIDSLTIKAFLEENYDFLLGSRLQKVQQPNRKEIIFHLRNHSESRKLYININPSFYHICFMSKENEIKRNIKIPKAPAMFCMLLRKYIEGAKIVEVSLPKYERIIEFYFDFFDVLNEKSRLCLSIELMGKHSNIILYNSDTNVIIGCAHNVSSEKSKDRELAGLLPFVYPPRQKKKDLLKTSFEQFVILIEEDLNSIEEKLSDYFYYLTRPLVRLLIKKFHISSSSKIDDFFLFYNELCSTVELKSISPNIDDEFLEFSIYTVSENKSYGSVNQMLDDYFSYHQHKYLISNLKTRLLTNINHQIKKLKQLKEKQEIQLKQIDKANIYKKKGDILVANLYQIEPMLNKIELEDFETGKKLQIELDPNLSPIENANRYYKLYKKTKSAYEYAKEMLEETKEHFNYYLEQKFYIEISDSVSDLEDIQIELKGEQNSADKANKKQKEINIETKEIGGYRIFIGKNSKQNDYILSKIASSEDIWFHPLNIAGSHVILKKNSPKDKVPEDVLFEAAKIAKENSSVSKDSKVPIIYTLRKYVKKANSKKLAFVTYKNETEILID